MLREVQGVPLWMPSSHLLADYAAVAPAYGQNLVELATLLAADRGEPLQVIDVGANIGDSAMQIRRQIDAKVLAVEGDPYYLDYLRRNGGDGQGVTVAPVLLTSDRDHDRVWTPTRRGGTTHFREQSADSSAPIGIDRQVSLPVSRLPATYPAFDNVGLIKSDTDGYDVVLIPELAVAYAESRPALFLEYDPALSASVSGVPAEAVWDPLRALGYDTVGFWSNTGVALGTTPVATAGDFASELLTQRARAGGYLDAVVVHAEDPAGQAAVVALFDGSMADG